MQDHSSSSSSSWGVSLSVGANGVGGSFNMSRSSSSGVWTNTLAGIASTDRTSVTVVGNTNLVGGAITSSNGATSLTTGTLTATNLTDSQTSSSSSFGLSLLASSTSVSLGMSSAQKLGVTSSVVSPGTITLTAPSCSTGSACAGADTSVLATLSRDPSGRQVVTVDTHSGFEATLSTDDFNALARVATNAQSLLNALSAAIPSDIAAGGPAAENAYRGLLSLGASREQADAAAQSSTFQTVVNHDQMVASGQQPTLSDFLLMVFGFGVQPDSISLDGCGNAGNSCSANLEQLRGVLRARTPAELVALFNGQNFVATSAMETGVGDAGDYADTLLNARLTQLIANCARNDPALFAQMIDALQSQPAEVQQAAARAAGMSWSGMVEIATASQSGDQQAFTTAYENNIPAALRGLAGFETGVSSALNMPAAIGVAGVQLANSEAARQQFGDAVAYAWNNPGAVASGLYDGAADYASRLARGEAGAIGSFAAFFALDGLGGFQLTQTAGNLARVGVAGVGELATRLGPAVDAGLADPASTAGAGGAFDWGAAWNVLRAPATDGAGGATAAGIRTVPENDPWIGNSQYRTTADFAQAAYEQYQVAYDAGYAAALAAEANGTLQIVGGVAKETQLGQFADRLARAQMQSWITAEGVTESAGGVILVNRRLDVSGGFRIPDIQIPGVNVVMDGTIGLKWQSTPQINDIYWVLVNRMSGQPTITIIRLGILGGSYSLPP